MSTIFPAKYKGLEDSVRDPQAREHILEFIRRLTINTDISNEAATTEESTDTFTADEALVISMQYNG